MHVNDLEFGFSTEKDLKLALACDSLQILLKTWMPQPREYYFQSSNKIKPELESQIDEWKLRFFDLLVSFGILEKNLKRGIMHYRLKNRNSAEALLKKLSDQLNSVQELEVAMIQDGHIEPSNQISLKPPVDAESEETQDEFSDVESEEDSNDDNIYQDKIVARVKPKRVDAAAVYELLEIVANRTAAAAELQVQVATTLAYVKDEVVFLREKQGSLSKRVKSIDEHLSNQLSSDHSFSPDNSDLKQSVDQTGEAVMILVDGIMSIATSVNSLKEEVRNCMSLSKNSDSQKLINVVETINKLIGEIGAIRSLVVEVMQSEEPDNE